MADKEDDYEKLLHALANLEKLEGKWYCEVDGCGTALPCRRHVVVETEMKDGQ